MSEPTTARLETHLRMVGESLRYPETPDLTGNVTQRVTRAPSSVITPVRSRFALGLAAAAAVALVAVVGVSPTARKAVAGWLGVDGIRITFDGDDELDQPVGEKLYLGSPATAGEAREAVAFEIATPAALGEPSAYYVRPGVEGGEVSLVWAPRSGLPESEHTGVGAVLTQFLGEAAPESLKKTADPGTRVTSVTVDGAYGFFIEGAPHLLVRDPSGAERTLSPRLAGNTLVWDGGDVTYRLEAEVDLSRALEIARSLEY